MSEELDFDLKEALMMLKDFYKKQAEYTNAIKNQNRMIDSLSHEIEDLKKDTSKLDNYTLDCLIDVKALKTRLNQIELLLDALKQKFK